MLEPNQTPLQARIQIKVTNGLGFGETEYLSNEGVYKKYLSEREVKNTQAGLDAHLAEMNFDREVAKYFSLRDEGFFGRIKARLHYAKVKTKYSNLKDKAVEEAIHNRGGLIEMILQHNFIKENLIPLLFYEKEGKE